MGAITYNRSVVQQSKVNAQPFFCDSVILLSVTALLVLSMVMIYSTSGVVSQERLGDAYFYVKRQGIALVVGLLFMTILSKLNIAKLRQISSLFLLLSLILLALVLVPGLGSRSGGATRWLKLGPISFQPVEYVKLFMVVFIAGYISKYEAELKEFIPGLLKPFFLVSLIAALLLLQPDFGSTAVITIIALAMLLASGTRIKHLALCAILASVSAGLLIASSPYRLQRVLTFLAPWDEPKGKGYQLIQSLIAVGSGRLTGQGLGSGQQKLFYLPAAHTDFIFAVIAEELGFIGCLGVLVLFGLLLWRGILIAGRLADNIFAYSLAIGVTALLVVPAFLNMAVVTGLLPTKGLALPLISYGGSSLSASLMAVGILLALSRAALKSVP